MQLDFITRAMIGGIGVALVAGPLGSIIIWRRMSNFGDTLAHSTLLGVCFSLLLNVNLYVGLIGISLIIASFLALLSQQRLIASDALLALISHTTLALGLILATLLSGIRMDLLGYLYGDILSINETDLIWIYAVNILVLLVLTKFWRSILSLTIDEDLAAIEGVSVLKVKWILIMVMAIVFAIAMKLVGVLLITALLIIPATSARQFSRTPEQMALFASILGILSVICGVVASERWDWPAGPAIVVIAAIVFFISFVFMMIRTHMRKILRKES